MLHFEEQRITAEAAEPVVQIHGCFRVLAGPRKLQQQRAESSRQGSDTFPELTLIVGSSPAYTGMRLQTVSPRFSDYVAIAPASLLCVCDFTSPPTAGVAFLTMSHD